MYPLLTETPQCVNDQGTWCYQVYQLTHNEWLAASAGWLVAKPIKIVLILLVAFLIRLVLRKVIDRVTEIPRNNSRRLPALLRPLRERAPDLLGPMVIERRRQRAKTIGSVLKSLTSFIVYGLAFIQVLGELGINLGPIIASAGIVGVALGFGAQNLVKDFLSGMFMMLEDQYGVGDVIDIGSATGTVESVGLRITTLRDMKGTVWYVRNGEVQRVGNSSQGYANAVVDVPLSYTADVDRAVEVLTRTAGAAVAAEPLAQDVLEPPQVLGVENVTPEGITIRLTVKVRPGKQWSVQRALRAAVISGLEEAGFDPPMGRFLGQPGTTGTAQ
ncbi:mechanosensitive ion channel family protein [Amycolatopsis acidiphila]|uniref:Mechanosensitive ion channel family protein n=1 Tax=Amycolatopsis acidiphila TaxID=715473 RepID=A0A558AD12_9PSEU|nr:mechanosensitive ion channel family protein [Amycolatopsis acidiphila]TVT22152.1 mechanosensitive ion channel family protein [Amycolatopsis acidiphila]UIJ61649.1 mechanosensitive ion channel family protein [Amycolatopsis acidiphila]GHG58664.1 mechanosensitive ion channel protein MscS [Amycolatopsis acidiphila]